MENILNETNGLKGYEPLEWEEIETDNELQGNKMCCRRSPQIRAGYNNISAKSEDFAPIIVGDEFQFQRETPNRMLPHYFYAGAYCRPRHIWEIRADNHQKSPGYHFRHEL